MRATLLMSADYNLFFMTAAVTNTNLIGINTHGNITSNVLFPTLSADLSRGVHVVWRRTVRYILQYEARIVGNSLTL